MATNALFNKHCPANIRLAFIFSGGGSVERPTGKGRGSASTVTVGICSVSARQPTVSAQPMNGE
jgi:hypothetical protein